MRIVKNYQQPASSLFREIERRNEQAFREFRIFDSLGPKFVFTLSVREPPSAIPESEDLHAIGDDLHLPIRGQDQRNVSTTQRRPAVSLISCRAGHWQRYVGVSLGPLLHVDDL